MASGNRNWRNKILGALLLLAVGARGAPTEAELKAAAEAFFAEVFQRLERVAAKDPGVDTFRAVAWIELRDVPGLFGASLIDGEWTIRQVLHRRDALALGYSLAKVPELDAFRAAMAATPAPQLSEPARGGLLQPRLISMRQPVVRDGRMVRMVSALVRTEAFLKATGLDTCKAFAITCLGREAERKGKLTPASRRVTLTLPSTQWTIDFE